MVFKVYSDSAYRAELFQQCVITAAAFGSAFPILTGNCVMSALACCILCVMLTSTFSLFSWASRALLGTTC